MEVFTIILIKKLSKLLDEDMDLTVILSVVQYPIISLPRSVSVLQNIVSKNSVGNFSIRDKYLPYKLNFVHTF